MTNKKKEINDLIWDVRFDMKYAWKAFYNALNGGDRVTFANEAYDWLLKAEESLGKIAELNDYKGEK